MVEAVVVVDVPGERARPCDHHPRMKNMQEISLSACPLSRLLAPVLGPHRQKLQKLQQHLR